MYHLWSNQYTNNPHFPEIWRIRVIETTLRNGAFFVPNVYQRAARAVFVPSDPDTLCYIHTVLLYSAELLYDVMAGKCRKRVMQPPFWQVPSSHDDKTSDHVIVLTRTAEILKSGTVQVTFTGKRRRNPQTITGRWVIWLNLRWRNHHPGSL